MTNKPTPTDAELFALIKEHFDLDQRRDDTVINRSTGRFHDAQRYRDFAAAVLALAKWGQPAVAAEPVAWAATSEDGDVEALGMNQSRRFDTPLYLAPQSVAREPVLSVLKAHLKPEAGPWCREALLYSPDNTGDFPENRVMLYTAPKPVAQEPLTDEQIQDLLLCGNPTDEEMRLIRMGWVVVRPPGGQNVE